MMFSASSVVCEDSGTGQGVEKRVMTLDRAVLASVSAMNDATTLGAGERLAGDSAATELRAVHGFSPSVSTILDDAGSVDENSFST